MIFKLPVIIYEEENCVYNHRTDIARLGKRALIVTGRNSSKKNGSLDDVRQALEDMQVGYAVFDEVEENPSVETVMRARQLGLERKVDFVIGLGGGSPIDAAKAIAIMLCYPDKTGAFLYERQQDVLHMPIVAIPTTCGTGSEATAVSVLTVHEKRTKASLPHRVFPSIALVDAGYLASAPVSVITATAVDALAHLVESYVNTGVSEYVKMFVDAGLSIWSRSKDILTGERTAGTEDYRNLMNASTLAGMAIAHDGTTIPHSLSYNITYELGVAHGTAVGHFLPGYLRETSEHDRSHVLQMAGFADMEEFETFIDKTCPVGVLPAELLARSVQSVLDNPAKLAACPYVLNRDVLERIAGLA